MKRALRKQGRPCVNCGGTERYACSTCVVCAARKVAQRRLQGTGVEKVYWRNYADKHKDKLQAYEKERYLRDKDKRNSRRRAWYLANKDKQHAYNKTYKRRVRQATPKWLSDEDLKLIRNYYEEAQRLSRETGVLYHVDHIIPLNGKNVSGLHVPWNLRCILSCENITKSNKFNA